MHRTPHLTRAWIGAGLLTMALTGTAHAAGSLSATLSNLTIATTGTVTLQEGATSAKTLQVYAIPESGYIGNGSFDSLVQVEDLLDISDGLFAPTQANASHASGVAGNVSILADGLTASVSTAGPGGISLASANLTGTFSLAAHSSLTITWSLDVQGQGQSNGVNTQEIAEEYILGAGVVLSGTDRSNNIFLQGPIFPNFAFGQTLANNQLTIQTGDTGMDVNFSAYIDLQLVDPGNSLLKFGTPPAVPEAETWAMALAGLALLGVGARRRLTSR